MQSEQQAILNFIHHYRGQYPPTIHEISEGLGFYNRESVCFHLAELEKQGYSKLRAYKGRSLDLT